MSTFKKLAQLTMIFFAMMVFFSSCEKEDMDQDQSEITTNSSTNTNNGATTGNFLALVNNQSEQGSIDSLEECFVINYPINLNIPGSGEVTVNSDEEMWETFMAFFEDAGGDLTDFPTIVFPITITLADGTTQSVANDEELCDVYHECFGDFGDDDGGWEDPDDDGDWDGEWEDPCFTFGYPLTLSDGNGNTTTVNSEEEWAAIFEDGDYVYFEIVYPVTVVLADGTTQSVADEEGLEALFADCYGDGWGDPGDCDSTFTETLCFEFVYPISLNMPDGSVITGNDEESLTNALMEYFEQNPDDMGEITLNYPVNVVLEDGTPQSLSNDEDLEELLEECFGDGFGLVHQKPVAGMLQHKKR